MNISKYIVPIYCEGVFNGTGFIAGHILITAAHVIISKNNVCCFQYEGDSFRIGPNNIIYYEYPEEKNMQGMNNRYMDLAMYNVGDFIHNPLELCSPKMSDSCLYLGYSDSITPMDRYDNIKLDNKDWYCPESERSIHINNTFISLGGKCKSGNSGGPLFQGDSIVGMLVGNQQFQRFSLDRYVSSNYIIEIISKL